MITLRDLEEAIAECQGQRNPNANTCVKLAAYYTIRRELFGEEKEAEQPSYSYAPAPDPDPVVVNDGDDDFARMVDGRDQAEIWPILNEAMETLQIVMPKLYTAVMDRLRR